VYRYTSLDSITPFPKNYTPSSYGILFLEGMAYDKEKKIPTLLKIIIKALFRTIAEERKREREGETERERDREIRLNSKYSRAGTGQGCVSEDGKLPRGDTKEVGILTDPVREGVCVT
jgi:hypothetical protein